MVPVRRWGATLGALFAIAVAVAFRIPSFLSTGHLKDQLDTIPGVVPSLIDLDPGCRFASRCVSRVEHDLEICTVRKPDLLETSEGHQVRCWLYQDQES